MAADCMGLQGHFGKRGYAIPIRIVVRLNQGEVPELAGT